MKEKLIETTTLSKEWLKEINAIPTQVAICCNRGRLSVVAIYWRGDKGGVWDDENALAIPSTFICDLPK